MSWEKYSRLKNDQAETLKTTMSDEPDMGEDGRGGKYQIIDIFCEEINKRTKGKFEQDVAASGKDNSGYLVCLMKKCFLI